MAKLQPIYKKVVESYSLQLDIPEVETILKAVHLWVNQLEEQDRKDITAWQTLEYLRKLQNEIKLGIQLGKEGK
jgi:hypothetical protein